MSEYNLIARTVWCPICGAHKGSPCVNTRMVYMPQPIKRSHKARYVLAKGGE